MSEWIVCWYAAGWASAGLFAMKSGKLSLFDCLVCFAFGAFGLPWFLLCAAMWSLEDWLGKSTVWRRK